LDPHYRDKKTLDPAGKLMSNFDTRHALDQPSWDIRPGKYTKSELENHHL
jgi:hypothetical protein